MMIPKEAKVCPHCRKKQGTSVLTWVVAIFFGIIFIGTCSSIIGQNTRKTSTVATENRAQFNINTETSIELQNWHWRLEHSYIITEGSIKNITDKSIDNIVAYVNLYDNKGDFITSDHALIDYRPLLPGQTSPFKIISTYNPAMNKAAVDFKTFGGKTLYWIKKGE